MARETVKQNAPNTPVSDSKIRGDVMSMIIPISIEGILQMISSTVIMALLGRIDVLAINAVGVGTRITQFLWSFVKGMGVGITVCVARDVGAKKTENLKLTSILGMLSLVIIVTIGCIFIWIFAEPIVAFFGGNPETIQNSISYMKIILWGLPFWSVSLTTAGVLQGYGDAKTPMIVSVIYNVVNIALGYVLMFGVFGLPKMGFFGAAYATVAAQVVVCVICLYILIKKDIITNMVPELKKDVQNTIACFKHLYRIGLPSAFENMVWQAGAIAMMKPIISFGEYPYATHQLAMQAESISYMPTMGFSIATTSLVGRCFGANDYETGHKYFKKIFKYMAVASATTMSILFFLPNLLMGMLTPSPEIVALGAVYLRITAITLLPQNLHGVYCGALKGAGHTKPPMYFAFIGLWGVRVTLSYIFAYLVPGSTIVWVWVAMSLDLTTRFLLSSTTFRRKKIFTYRGFTVKN